MDAAQWKKIETLYHEALEKPPGERREFLDSVCGNDEPLKKELLSLLVASEEIDGFMSHAPLGEELRLDTATSLIEKEDRSLEGRLIGPYCLEKWIASGGMGSVYLASRTDGSFEQKVAIKLIRGGLQNKNIIKRFFRERQTLANLNHPNIARLLFGDTTDDGNPYLVMEYIDGSSIDDYCDMNKLSITDRLLLFRHVCSAVAYAHGKLVVHRDIKPGNILVTRSGHPKLLDFGIVKIIDPESTAPTASMTLTMQRLMTPHYASPEQMRGDSISTATDIYSLGVVLYELLTGHRPYRFETTSIREVERIICEVDPPKPSTVVGQVMDIPAPAGKKRTVTPAMVSETREGRPEKLRRRLAGDLDDIIMKALRKEPEKRYTSVEHFSADIERHLAGLPVHASKGTWTYRAEKYMRRHLAGFLVTACILVLLGIGIYFALQNERRAQNQESAQQVLELLTQLYKMPNSNQTPRDEIRRILESENTKQHVNSLRDQPEELIRYADTIVRVCENFHLRDLAVEWGALAMGTRESLQPPDDPTLGDYYFAFARSLHEAGDFDAAEANIQKAINCSTDSSQKIGEYLHLQALIVFGQGNYKKAISLFEQALQTFQLKGLELSAERIMAQIDFARIMHSIGDNKRASFLLNRSYEEAETLPSGDKTSLLRARIHHTMGTLLWTTPRFRLAEIYTRKALLLYMQLRVDSGGLLASCMSDLYMQSRYYYRIRDIQVPEASGFWRKARSLTQATFGEDSWETARCDFDLSFRATDSTATHMMNKVIKAYRSYWPEDHIQVARVKTRLGVCLSGYKRTHSSDFHGLKAGEKLINEALRIQLEHLFPEHWDIGISKVYLGFCVFKQQRYDEGKSLIANGLDILRASLGEGHPDLIRFYNQLQLLYRGHGYIDEADELLNRCPGREPVCFYTNMNLISDCDGTHEFIVGIDFEDDFMEKVLVIDENPETFERAYLWIYGKPFNWPHREFEDLKNVIIRVNFDPSQEIAFNPSDRFTGIIDQFQWIPFEVPLGWLVEGPNTFSISIAHDKDYKTTFSWEYNNLYVGVDKSADFDRSWWFGSGPQSCCKEMEEKAYRAKKPLLRSDPMFEEHRPRGYKECEGELMVVLEYE